MTRVLVTGAGGQLGRELLETAPPEFEICALERAELDITDAEGVARVLAAFHPAVIFNGAAYTRVDQAEHEKKLAFAVNADGVANLARGAAELGCRLVHVSTDFVFDGSSTRPYRTTDPTGPTGVYGASKLAGEREALAAGGDVFVVRSAWLYSRFGRNFVKTMLRVMTERDELGVVSDQFGCPTWVRGLAEALWCLASVRRMPGLLHWTDQGSASWYDFAVAIQTEAISIGLLERKIPIRALTTDEYPTSARRPAYSVLERDEAWRSIAPAPRPWREHLRSMLAELKERGDA